MANHKSAKKRIRQNAKRTERNRNFRSRMRRAMREARAAAEAKSDNKDELITKAISEVNRAASRNILKSGTASRYMSRLMLARAR